MIRKIIFGSVIALMGMGCSQERTTPGGFKFNVLKKGDGKELAAGSYLIIDLLVKDSHDSTWADTRKDGFPISTRVQAPGDPSRAKQEGLEAVFRMMSKGDSVTFSIPAHRFFREMWREPVPKKVDADSHFTFYVKAKDVLDEPRWRKFQQEMVNKQNALYLKQQAEQLGKDTVTIDNFLREKGIKAQTTPLGIRYVITKPGHGPTGKSGQIAMVQYKGYLLNGTIFDTNVESFAKANNLHQRGRLYAPYEVRIDYTQVIRGWHEMLTKMNAGSTATVYIPSTLAYGPQRKSELIKENEILVFDLEVLSFKKN